MTKILLGILLALSITAAVQSYRVARLKDDVVKVQGDLRVANATAEQAGKNTINANDISRIAADACRSTIQVRVQHQEEAREIRDPSTGSAADSYRRLMCQRPEAAGHPACAASPR